METWAKTEVSQIEYTRVGHETRVVPVRTTILQSWQPMIGSWDMVKRNRSDVIGQCMDL